MIPEHEACVTAAPSAWRAVATVGLLGRSVAGVSDGVTALFWRRPACGGSAGVMLRQNSSDSDFCPRKMMAYHGGQNHAVPAQWRADMLASLSIFMDEWKDTRAVIKAEAKVWKAKRAVAVALAKSRVSRHLRFEAEFRALKQFAKDFPEPAGQSDLPHISIGVLGRTFCLNGEYLRRVLASFRAIRTVRIGCKTNPIVFIGEGRNGKWSAAVIMPVLR